MRSCEESTGQTYNPYGVTDETAVCNETTGSRYHKRCIVLAQWALLSQVFIFA